MDYFKIGQRIRKNRKARELSQEQLAEKVGISTTHMSHIETGNTKLSLPVLVDLAAVLEVRVDELLHDNNELERSSAVEEIARTLESCTTQQLKIMADIVKATQVALKKNM